MCCSSSSDNNTPGPNGQCKPGDPKNPCPAPKLIKITVVKNATQTNVMGAKNWATVKKSSDDVVVEATTDPNTDEAWKQITWSGDTGSAVPGKANQRTLSRAAAAKLTIKAELGGVKDELTVWVIWSDLVITIGTSDTIDTGNDASGLAAGHKWPAMLGGGNNLGPMSKEGTSLTYAYTVGKMQAKATLQPAGVEDVVARDKWLMKRKATIKGYDNGVRVVDWTDHDDTSKAPWTDLDPKSGSSTREIYDLDAPGCSIILSGTTINHTADIYDNFTQWAAVTLDSEQRCSDEKTWSYTAQVDVDKATGKVEKNELSLSHITVPTSSKYTTR